MTDGRARLLDRIPPYPFQALEEKARSAGAGPAVLRFAIGDPDLPPPASVIDGARTALAAPDGHRYSSSRGEPTLRSAFARWMERRFGVTVDPETEVCVLVGSKEGINGLPRALLDPGDRVVVPDPGYPAYANAAVLARERVVRLPLRPEASWLPEWEKLPENGRLLYLNYPNNPTGAVARKEDLLPAVELAHDRGFTIAYDNAYSELTFGRRAPSILEVPGARDVAVEFHSLSKTLGMPGWRIGFAVGDATRIASLVALKGHADSGAATPLQRAAAVALDAFGPEGWPEEVRRSIEQYGTRLAALARGLVGLGATVDPPEGTLYLWHRAPRRDGAAFADRLLDTARVLVTPGEAFGRRGRGYVRWSVTEPMEAIAEAVRRMEPLDLFRTRRRSALSGRARGPLQER